MTQRLHSRRRVLQGLSALPLGLALGGVATRTQGATAACVLSPEMTEGPFFVDERLQRSDLVGPDAGPGLRDAYPLALVITLVNARERCAPVAGLQVDV